MFPEHEELMRKASCLDLSKLKTEILASPSFPEEFKKHSDNLLTEYRRFLVLKVIFGDTSPPLNLSPSAIIDQVWHLHLLSPVHYIKCCKLLGEEVLDHDISASRDREELRQERLDTTMGGYSVIFGEAPPKKFWALNYQFSSQLDLGESLNNPVGVKNMKRSHENAFEKKHHEDTFEKGNHDYFLDKMYRPKLLALTYQPNTDNHKNSEDGKKEVNRINPTDVINIRVREMDSPPNFIHIKMRRNTKMKKLYESIEKMEKYWIGSFRLIYDGPDSWSRLDPNDTPENLLMEDGDVVELYQNQAGC